MRLRARTPYRGTGYPSENVANAVVVDDAVGRVAHDIEIELASGRAARRQRAADARIGDERVVCPVLGPGVEHRNHGSDTTPERVNGHHGFIQLTVVRHGVGARRQVSYRVADRWSAGAPVVQSLLLTEWLDVVGRRRLHGRAGAERDRRGRDRSD